VLALKDRVAELDRALAALPMPPEVGLLQTVPGIGLTTALTIVGDTGAPTRFQDVHRYVERTLAWMLGYRRLATRYDRHAITVLGLLHLACALICARSLQRAEAAMSGSNV
jgi:hypothetical protein